MVKVLSVKIPLQASSGLVFRHRNKRRGMRKISVLGIYLDMIEWKNNEEIKIYGFVH